MTIIDKLKLDKYMNMVVINQPSDYDLFNSKTTDLYKDHDAIFIFVQTIENMVEHTRRVIRNQLLVPGGYLFFAYPKKGNTRYKTFVHRDEIFPAMEVNEDGYIANSDIKFSRLVSMDDVFTVVGLKREKMKSKKSSSTSQRIADYVDRVEDIEKLLTEHPDVLAFFQSLTPGYQKDWARHIFSAKQQKTLKTRQQQMIEVLSQGYKSMDLFRQSEK